jgi:hypothetical protein
MASFTPPPFDVDGRSGLPVRLHLDSIGSDRRELLWWHLSGFRWLLESTPHADPGFA